MNYTADGARIAREPETDLARSQRVFARILRGYRFTVCDPESRERAYEVRRRVYVEDCGYRVEIPDEYDGRSWVLLAEDTTSGEAVGTLRITSRMGGPLEAEEYFKLPPQLRSPRTAEITRFAILPGSRTKTRILPVVWAGLVKTAIMFMSRIGIRWLVVCSTPERVWAYTWLNLQRTGLHARYGHLNRIEHELLICNLPAAVFDQGHRFKDSFFDVAHPEIVLPPTTPDLDVVPYRRRRTA